MYRLGRQRRLDHRATRGRVVKVDRPLAHNPVEGFLEHWQPLPIKKFSMTLK